MKIFRVEYFITVHQDEILCRDRSSFEVFLKSVSDFSIKENYITYKSIEVEYEVDAGEVSIDQQRYFHIILKISREAYIDEFEGFLKLLRTILSKVNVGQIQVLWDDLGFYYAYQAYPLVHEIENVMRKLISKFMLTYIGSSWFKDSAPREVSESIRIKESKNKVQSSNYSYLYEADFIQLSNFLFKEYSPTSIESFSGKIRKANAIEDLNLNDLKKCLPKSNWERYFASLVDCESDFLRTRWEQLYERRNQIAHNKPMSKTEFNELQKLVGEIKPKLQEAVSKLDKVILREDQRESIVENAVENLTYRQRLTNASKAALVETSKHYIESSIWAKAAVSFFEGFSEETGR